MDPLSVIASVIAITEAFGVGVKTPKGLADTSSEFSDMLAELSSLQAWLDQLRLTIDNMTVAQLMGDEKKKELSKKGVPKVSVITWQRMRGRIQKLKDRAKRCREELSACLDLVGLSQQLQQHQTSRDILTISHTQYSLMQTTLVKFESHFNDLESMLLRNMPTPESPVMEPLPEEHCAEPDSTGSSSHLAEVFSIPQMSMPQKFCHPDTVVVTGSCWLDDAAVQWDCCKSGEGRELRVAYAFPSWLTRRAVQFSACWALLTDMGATLHLRVPTVCRSGRANIFRLLLSDEDIAGLRKGIATRYVLPTDVDQYGWDFLLFCVQRQYFQSASFLLDVGFNHSNQEPKAGWSAKQWARKALVEHRHGLRDIGDELRFQTCVKIAGDIEEQPEVSTLIRDAVLGIGSVTLEDALAVEGYRVNEIDDGGYPPLHWAITFDNMDQVRLLVEHGADIELRTRYHHQTPLRLAVLTSHRRIVAFLLSNGASTAARDFNNCGMLHGCIDPEVVRILLEAKADPNEAQCPSKRSPLHHLVEDYKTTARWLDQERDIALQLLRSGCDLEARSSVGRTALLMAVSSGLQKVTGFLHRQGARLDAIDNDGFNILHYTAIAKDLFITDYIRSLEIEGIDPDGGDTPGGTALAYLQKRMRYAGVVGGVWPTQRSVFSFYALISEIRWRNWELGMFLEREQQLERNGHLDNIRRWLGWQWRKMHDDPQFAAAYFHHFDDQFPEDFIDEELEVDYNTDILLPRLDQVMDNLDPGVLPGVSHDDGTEDIDEFFDATE
ncbi:Ankyrin repeat-containing domain protein [Rhypophila decipiens]